MWYLSIMPLRSFLVGSILLLVIILLCLTFPSVTQSISFPLSPFPSGWVCITLLITSFSGDIVFLLQLFKLVLSWWNFVSGQYLLELYYSGLSGLHPKDYCAYYNGDVSPYDDCYFEYCVHPILGFLTGHLLSLSCD